MGIKNTKTPPHIEQEIIQFYTSGVSPKVIGEKYELAISTIIRILKRNDVKRNRCGTPQKFTCDDNFFEKIDTEEKAYWLGFIAADGSVGSGRQKSLTIGLQRKDREHLECFLKHINSTNKVKLSQSKLNNKHYDTVLIFITSEKIHSDLSNYNVIPRKTYTYFPLELSSKLLRRHFLRGFFDGDGSVHLKNVNTTSPQIAISFCSTSIKCFEIIQGWLFEDLNFKKTKIDMGHSKQIKYAGNLQMKAFFEYLYDNSSVYLTRKRETFVRLLEIISHNKPSKSKFYKNEYLYEK